MKIELKLDHLPKDTEFAVQDFPVTLVNGKTVDVTDDQIEQYEQFTGKKFSDTVDGITGAKVIGGGTK